MICTLGDLLLDVIVRLEQPLAPRAGRHGADNPLAWRPGGERRRLGSRPRRQRPSGGQARRRRRRPARPRGGRGVGIGPVVPAGTGMIVSLVAPDGERTMASDRGVAPTLGPAEIEDGWFTGCTWLHLSGYALVRDPIRFAAARAAELARAEGRTRRH